jgi:cysteine-rich repeat protein
MNRKHLGAYVAVTGALFIVGSGLQACGSDDSSGGGGKGGSGAKDGSTGGTAGGGNAECGNGTIESQSEECDDGNLTSGDGCDNDCKYTCTAGDTSCDDGNACTGTESCGSDHKCVTGTPLNEGDSCGDGLVCVSGNCVSAACGDGQQQTGEECDDGDVDENNGCNTQCTFSCLSTDTTKDCTATGDECAGSNVCDDTAHTCTGGTPLAENANCKNNTGTCKSGICTLKTCGNGTVDAGEQCEPPGTATCNAQCQNIVAAACGDGTIQAPEQCDDNNTSNLDGCNSTCKYEMVTRLRTATIQGGAAPSFCSVTKNQLGTVALTSTAIGQLNTSLQTGIDEGSTNVIVQALNLDDLTGTADPTVELGIMAGGLDPAKGTWPATGNPIDWWFLVQNSNVDANGLPLGKLTGGAIAAKVLTAGPSDVNLSLLLSGSPALLEMRDAKVRGVTTGTPSVPAPPPATLAPGLTTFPEVQADQANQGLCGNITVASLAKIPIPESLAKGSSTACGACGGSKEYTYCGANQPVGANCNSLLDALVGGCKVSVVLPCLVTAINATQPDVPKPGGSLTPLSVAGSLNKVPAAQSDNNKDAYSAYLRFNARRAHLTGKQTP